MNHKEMLIYCLRGMKRKAHGAQEPRHIQKYVEVTSAAQRSDSPAQAINQRFHKYICFTILFLLLSGMCAVSVKAQDSDEYISNVLSQILQAVQKNVDFQKNQMIDLISMEEITIEEFDTHEKISKITSVTSNYRAFPEKTTTIPDCNFVSKTLASLLPLDKLREEREVLSIKENGKVLKKFTEPFWAKGSSYIDYFMIFDKQNEKCFDYELMNSVIIDGRSVYTIGIKQKAKDIGGSGMWEWELLYEGIALIDAETMEFVRSSRGMVPLTYYNVNLKSNYLPRKSVSQKQFFFTQYTYEKVKIGDYFMTLPVEKFVRLFQENGQLHTSYKSRYSNYRAFTVNTKIIFDTIDESSDEIDK